MTDFYDDISARMCYINGSVAPDITPLYSSGSEIFLLVIYALGLFLIVMWMLACIWCNNDVTKRYDRYVMDIDSDDDDTSDD